MLYEIFLGVQFFRGDAQYFGHVKKVEFQNFDIYRPPIFFILLPMEHISLRMKIIKHSFKICRCLFEFIINHVPE